MLVKRIVPKRRKDDTRRSWLCRYRLELSACNHRTTTDKKKCLSYYCYEPRPHLSQDHRSPLLHISTPPAMSKGVCEYAFAVLENKLKGTPLKPLASYEPDAALTSKRYPLFVTWNRNGNLRGCIGTFADMPLEQGVKRFALSSALQDSRFPPITASELPQLSVSVTLLANFTPIHKWDDWTVGVHGLRVEFDYHHRPHSGTFLPSVAEEEGWDKVTTVWNLLRKSDVFDVAKSDTVAFYEQALAHKTMALTRYEGLKSSMQWSEYDS